MCNLSFTNKFFENIFFSYYKSLFDGGIPDSTCDPLQSLAIAKLYLSEPIITDCKFIHIVRDPRDVITSFMNWKQRKYSGIIAHHMTPYWNLKPLDNNFKLSKVEQFAWVWKFKNKLFEELQFNNYNYKLYKFEDLIKNEELIKEIFDFLEIKLIVPINFLKVNKNPSKKYFPKWTTWDTDLIKKVHLQCGVLMQKYGYGIEKNWQNHVKK